MIRPSRSRQTLKSAVATFVLLVLVAALGACDLAEPTANANGARHHKGAQVQKLGKQARTKVKRVKVPLVRKTSLAQAQRRLRAEHLKVQVRRVASWAPVGTVIAQKTHAGTRVIEGAVITLVVAKAMPSVPRVVGRSANAAASALRQAGFSVRRTTSTVSSGTNGAVLSQSPLGAARARPGSVVTITVARVVKPVAQAPVPLVNNNCTPGYRPCLAPASDYDCAGGSGNGPKYAVGPIYVTGNDPYELDYDGDGVACEAY